MHYYIKKAEKISDIIERTDIPFDMICRYNSFVEDIDGVYENQKLQFPTLYTVLPGDTYQSIGERFEILPTYLRELNPYIETQGVIYPGQTIFLPPF